ncbi:MAG: hypothetical protein FWD52_09980 [Candidatus Bathyarchaeota archaeon]|nr:hypothetical protein [Candidatus Termiticorpusculum sp.]
MSRVNILKVILADIKRFHSSEFVSFAVRYLIVFALFVGVFFFLFLPYVSHWAVAFLFSCVLATLCSMVCVFVWYGFLVDWWESVVDRGKSAEKNVVFLIFCVLGLSIFIGICVKDSYAEAKCEVLRRQKREAEKVEGSC